MAGLTILIPPPCEPVSLAEAKVQLRVSASSTTEDTRIRGAVRAARIYCENFVRRQMVLQTVRLTWDRFPGFGRYPWMETFAGPSMRVIPNPKIDDDAIRLDEGGGGWGPLQSVLSLQYVDEAGATQTLDAADYVVDAANEPPRLMPPPQSGGWPEVLTQINSVSVTYAAGLLVPFVADAAADTLTLATGARAPVNGTAVLVRAGDRGSTAGTIPTGLDGDTLYYVVNASGQSCKLAATPGGTALDLTTAGTGIGLLDVTGRTETIRQAILLMTGYLFENRGDGTKAVEAPPAVEALLSQERIWKF